MFSSGSVRELFGKKAYLFGKSSGRVREAFGKRSGLYRAHLDEMSKTSRTLLGLGIIFSRIFQEDISSTSRANREIANTNTKLIIVN